MRKATIGAILLAVQALTFGSPLRDLPQLHRILSLAGLGGYILLSLDMPVRSVRQRNLLIAGVLASVLAFLLVVTSAPTPFDVVARILAVATIALPLWLVAHGARYAFVAAGALAASTIVPAIADAGGYATSLHAYVAAAAALYVAALLHKPALATPGASRKPPRRVAASNIVTWTPDQKAAALARLEAKYAAGEMPEHVYLDKRQEIESR